MPDPAVGGLDNRSASMVAAALRGALELPGHRRGVRELGRIDVREPLALPAERHNQLRARGRLGRCGQCRFVAVTRTGQRHRGGLTGIALDRGNHGGKLPRVARALRQTAPGSPLLATLEWFVISAGGQVTLGAVPPIGCAAIAHDGQHTRAALKRQTDENLMRLPAAEAYGRMDVGATYSGEFAPSALTGIIAAMLCTQIGAANIRSCEGRRQRSALATLVAKDKRRNSRRALASFARQYIAMAHQPSVLLFEKACKRVASHIHEARKILIRQVTPNHSLEEAVFARVSTIKDGRLYQTLDIQHGMCQQQRWISI